jgi:hypothetical protein
MCSGNDKKMDLEEEDAVLGTHPSSDPWHRLDFADGETNAGVAHRALSVANGHESAMVKPLRNMLLRHHVSKDTQERDKARQEAYERLGYGAAAEHIQRFPQNPSTMKGNLAEIVLAEYIVDSSAVDLPIYRLRYNPNVDQSMKGDDVLAFDLDSDPIRIVVGEAKYRGSSTRVAADEMIDGLMRAKRAGLPASLTFVADRLYELQEISLANRVMDCVLLFSQDALRIDYVGLLMSDARASDRVNVHTPTELHRLALISLNLAKPDELVTKCYDGLDK